MGRGNSSSTLESSSALVNAFGFWPKSVRPGEKQHGQDQKRCCLVRKQCTNGILGGALSSIPGHAFFFIHSQVWLTAFLSLISRDISILRHSQSQLLGRSLWTHQKSLKAVITAKPWCAITTRVELTESGILGSMPLATGERPDLRFNQSI